MSTYYLPQGQESSQDEKAAAALHAVHLDDQYGGAPVQVSIPEFPPIQSISWWFYSVPISYFLPWWSENLINLI